MTETTENEALEKSGNEEKLTVEDMRKMLIETGLPKLINESVERISAKLPRKPTLPDNSILPGFSGYTAMKIKLIFGG